MTKQRFKQACNSKEPRYYLHATTSRLFARTFGVNQVELTYGPYLRKSTVRRKQAAMRKERVETFNPITRETTDCGGKTFSTVYWREVI